MKRWIVISAALLAFTAPVYADDLTVDLHYEPTATTEPSQGIFAIVKQLRPVMIDSFSDTRSGDLSYVGDLKVNGLSKRVLSKTALSNYATDVFRKVYGEWGGKISPESQLHLKGQITQFKIEEFEGYQARVGFHFYLHDNNGKVLWDGHSSGIVKGTGRTITPHGLSVFLSDILRVTYAEMLEDFKLVGVWSGKVSNTFIVSDGATTTADQSGAGR